VKNTDGQRNCMKHVEFHCKNKIEKSVHLVGFIIRIYHDARSYERQKDHPLYELADTNVQFMKTLLFPWKNRDTGKPRAQAVPNNVRQRLCTNNYCEHVLHLCKKHCISETN
jgi:hypothetical protein